MPVALCIPTPDVPLGPELEVSIPFIGQLKSMTKSLYDIMDPSEFLVYYMDKLSVALGPVRQFLEVLEVLIAIKSCFDAVIDALIPPSPGPLYDCLKGLLESLQRLLRYIPPFQYIVTLTQVLALVIELIDAIVDLIIELDKRITALSGMLKVANEFEDESLIGLHECASAEVKTLLVSSLDPLQVIQPIITVLMEAIIRFVPDPQLQEDFKEFKKQFAALEDMRDSILSGGPLPSVTPLLSFLEIIRTIMVTAHNILAPIVVLPPSAVGRQFPTLNNL